MSRFGDGQEFQNELSEALEKRSREVGNRQAIAEMASVMAAHCEYYWHDEAAMRKEGGK